MRRVSPDTTATIYAYADFDDQRLTSRTLCHPMDIQAFFGQSQEESLYTTILDDGKIYYALLAEDETEHMYLISRDDMIDIPEHLIVREMECRFNQELNQYVKMTPHIRPHATTLNDAATTSSIRRRKRNAPATATIIGGGDGDSSSRNGRDRYRRGCEFIVGDYCSSSYPSSCRDGECRSVYPFYRFDDSSNPPQRRWYWLVECVKKCLRVTGSGYSNRIRRVKIVVNTEFGRLEEK